MGDDCTRSCAGTESCGVGVRAGVVSGEARRIFDGFDGKPDALFLGFPDNAIRDPGTESSGLKSKRVGNSHVGVRPKQKMTNYS